LKSSGIFSRKNLKIIFALTCIFPLCFFTYSVKALTNTDYTIVEGSVRMPIAQTYTLKAVINKPGTTDDAGLFSAPEDLFFSEDGYLYVVDTGNSRVVKMKPDGTLVGIFKGPEEKPLKNPKGIFADADGMYIADSGNYRILHLSSDGSFVEEFTRPISESLPSDFIFDPSKVIVTKTGYIYALKGQYLISIDGYNRFRGYVGQSKIDFSLREMLVRLFGSEKQKTAIRTRIAASYTNIVLDNDGLIFATTQDSRDGEIKRLNAVGINIYRNYNASSGLTWLKNLVSYSFDDLSFRYGDNSITLPNFVDLAVDSSGIISALDGATCKIFQYDLDGNLLAVFGSSGELNGSFTNPVSIACDSDGNLYVLDKSKNNIQVFEPTEFIKTIHAAVMEYHNGDYKAAEKLWNQVLDICESYQMANIGIGDAAFKLEDWKTAMEQYKLASDRLGYSEAFAKYRHQILRQHFLLVVAGCVLSAVLLGLIIMGLKKVSEAALERYYAHDSKRYSVGNLLLIGIGTIFHPFEVFSIVRGSRKKLKWQVVAILLAAMMAARVIFIYGVHYPLVKLDPRDANLLLEFAKLVLPVVTFALSCFMITSIIGGESKLDEIFTAFSFSTVLYTLVTILLTILSHVLCREEQSLFVFIIYATRVLTALLFLLNIYILNNYTVKKTLVVAGLSVITTVLIWIVILMVLSLTVQLIEFVTGIMQEIRMINM